MNFRIFRFLSALPNRICTALILGLRPILGPAICKFEPTCTKFAVKCLAEQPFHTAIWLIIRRLLSCSPFI